ncbi:hypothetical protein [Streptomyces sp. NPDC088794]|uniref:hypothetical protein n=1 Tax=Streptomyces sp. NPDC088794 TaxID=3365902 RepID=UPI003822A6FB
MQTQGDRPVRAHSGAGGSWIEGLREMRRTRIEKRRRSVRVRRYSPGTHAWSDLLDPRDPDLVRAKRLPRPERPARAARPEE